MNTLTYLVAYNVGADFEIHFSRVEASCQHEALIYAFETDYPALKATKNYEEALAFLHDQNYAIGIRVEGKAL